MDNKNWVRARFETHVKDWRPVTWPPPGPYWCSGYNSDGHAIIISYGRNLEKIQLGWPEAKNIQYSHESEICFTTRFPKPVWWDMFSQNG